MDKIRQVDSKKIKMKPKSYEEGRAIWTLMHFNELRDDFVDSFNELMNQNKTKKDIISDSSITTVSRTNCDAFKELVYLISQLELIDTMKQGYSNTCDYVELTVNKFIKNSKVSSYPSTSLRRHIKVIATFMEEQMDMYPELYKHLDWYMRNCVAA